MTSLDDFLKKNYPCNTCKLSEVLCLLLIIYYIFSFSNFKFALLVSIYNSQ